MQKPEIPACEAERIQALQALNILDTKPEKTYGNITHIAKVFFDVPIVAISLVDVERQWFKSIQGLDVCETSREVSFCGHTILQEGVFIVEDTLEDCMFRDNPLVTGEPNIRFYAGFPLKDPSGYNIGSLCIIDTKPRKFSKKKLRILKKLCKILEQEFFEKRKSLGYLNEIAKIQEMIWQLFSRQIFHGITLPAFHTHLVINNCLPSACVYGYKIPQYIQKYVA